ncbi:hypothetical protein Forpe1208_v014464 [Fusarium oxysporum f. sp. rapae]|uniref:Uncharacterized protein n=1 Tax=Fusarium oxysporum f. sp. rapae TaxID=485398 RepID=A0A8J5NLU7_FUSOX|nr:hypothetical protein Forpe1208_v014464 [Fusarium oxysporum f. sp. rapae]
MSSRAIQTSDIGGDVVIPINRFKQKQHGPYQTYLTGLLGTHPHLQVLEHFIDEDDWENWRVHGHPKDHGLTKFDVIVLDIEPSPGSSTTASLSTSPHLESGEAVKRYTERHRLKDPGSLRLFLAEDLSRDLIEYFGSKYGLDPNFFEGHLRGHERLLSGRPLPKYLSAVHPTPPSVSEASTASYFTAGFYRPYKFGNGDQHSWPIVQKIRWETENVIRHGVAYLKLKSTDAFFLNERFSIIAIPAAVSESAMTGT